jgi:hypothetical protein
MDRSRQKASCALLLLFILVGTATLLLAFWLINRPQGMSGSGITIALSLGISFVSYTWALLLYLQGRDGIRAAIVRKSPQTAHSRPDLEGTLYGLVPGYPYQVMKSFTDYYGNSFDQGEILRFKERHFLPYDGGHTIVFVERSLYLQEDKNREILDKFSEYIAQLQ